MVVPLVTSHAPMLGRTLLYTALTRARQLVVLVGQQKALYLAARDWRRVPRHTALGGPPDGTLRLGWRLTSPNTDEEKASLDVGMWGKLRRHAVKARRWRHAGVERDGRPRQDGASVTVCWYPASAPFP